VSFACNVLAARLRDYFLFARLRDCTICQYDNIYKLVNNLHLLSFLGSRVGRASDTSPVGLQFNSR
jgi:hypothetical protein